MDTKKYKQELLNDLYEPYKNCTMCPLGILGRQNVVFGEGNPDATLMFVGEGPGQKEDQLCRPFVGRSGQLLTKVLEAVGLSREDVFITNVVKCRPPNNRKPLPNESEICTNLLLFKQIKIIRPKVICTLGSAATQVFLGKDIKITKMRGKMFDKNGFLMIPTYHPAYILRNNRELENFADDIKLAKKHST
ncbi:uracil-DNA glycosylase [Candidatus Dependentiae bacterium]